MKVSLQRPLVLLITFCTGFSGLVYEVVWHRYLSNLLGSQAQAASLIIAVFLGGLALGYAIFGSLSSRRSRRFLVSLCGLIEIGIGLWALKFPGIFGVIWVEQINGTQSGSFLTDLFYCIVLIGLPTTLMGGTLPLLTQGLSRNVQDSAQFHARIYAVNTGGAFLGCVVAGFFMIPYFGLPQTVISMGVLNVLAGLILIIISQQLPTTLETVQQDLPNFENEKTQKLSVISAAMIAGLAGFSSISLQTVVMRLIGLSAGSSEYAFSMAVGCFILMLTLGAWRLSSEQSIALSLWFNQLLIAAGLIIVSLLVPYWPYLSHVIRSLLTSQAPNFYLYHLILFSLLSLVILLPVGAMGSTLPLLFRESRGSFKDLGSRVGIIYGINTIGCVFGALLGGHLLLYVVDLYDVFIISLLLILLSCCIAVFSDPEPQGKTNRVTLITILLILSICLPRWPTEVLAIGTFRTKSATETTYQGFSKFYADYLQGRKIVAYKDDPNTSVAVVEAANGNRSLYVNGKSDGSTTGGDRVTTKLLAHLPALFTLATNGNAAVIGYGTGITAGTLALYSQIQQIDLIEISPFVRRFAPFFDFANYQASTNSKIKWHVIDAYRHLTSTTNQYSIIISEPSNPWVTGVERLYSADFYDIVKQKLLPGGIYAQWFHSYSISEDTINLVLHTFKSSFPEVRIFLNDYDLILLGSAEPISEKAISAAESRMQDKVISEDLQEIGYDSIKDLLGMELWFPLSELKDAKIHTLDYPQLSYQAGYDFFIDRIVDLEEFADTKKFRTLSRQFWPQSLLGEKWKNKDSNEALFIIAQSLCHTKKPGFVRGWRDFPYPCRSAIVALGVRGILQTTSPEVNQDLEFLRRISDLRQTSFAAKDVEHAISGLNLIADYASPWLTISAERIKSFVQPCFSNNSSEALSCRQNFADTLTWRESH